MSSLSLSSSGSTISSNPMATANIDWYEKAQNECENYPKLFPGACEVVKTASKILERVRKEEDKAVYQVIKYLQQNNSCSLLAIYRSFCNQAEVRIIKKCYPGFFRSQKVAADVKVKSMSKQEDDQTLLESFRRLDLESHSKEETRVRSLAKGRASSPITHSDLNGGYASSGSIQRLAQMLPQTRITTLDLGQNSIGSEGIRSLAQALPRSRITILDLSGGFASNKDTTLGSNAS